MRDTDDEIKDDSSCDSADDALFEFLGGISKLSVADEVPTEVEQHSALSLDQLLKISDNEIQSRLDASKISWREQYDNESIIVLPQSLSIPASDMRRLTEELVWNEKQYYSDRTFESVGGRRTLTRLENFFNTHAGWNDLVNNYLRRVVSIALGVEMVLFKEKLNLKPGRGGAGFAPHLDTPSLRVALSPSSIKICDTATDKKTGPSSFVTVMVAIDNMTSLNGCLRVVKGPWSEANHVTVIKPDCDGNPDAGGRAGAIPLHEADKLDFEDVPCSGGTIVAFGGWTPHRSGVNKSYFARRAVFLTFNPASQGDYHDRYYALMTQLRNDWRNKVGLESNETIAGERVEDKWLSSVPS